jgi:hypothetical protein
MRANLVLHANGELFNPQPESHHHETAAPARTGLLRVERQVLLRLPVTRAVVFSIHTYLLRPEALDPERRARLEALHPGAFAP